jgi:CheY-like chemotaxis protein
MALQCLLVTCDANLLGDIKALLSEYGALLDLRQDCASAIELASRRHWDGVVIDCDDLPGGAEAIKQVRNSRSNKQTPIFAVLNGSTSVEEALALGANFVLCKPVLETRLRGVLDICIPKMEREHRRYFRCNADLPVRLWNHDGQSFHAKMMNISEGGLAIKLVDSSTVEGVINVEFDLPGVDAPVFRARAEVVWSDALVTGLRFLYVDKSSSSALERWLSPLEAQVQFRESCPHSE